MEAIVQSIFVLGALALLSVPVGLILVGLARMRRRAPDWSWTLMGVGGLILCLVSLDILVTVLVARIGSAEMLARYALYSAYGSEVVSYVGLLMLGTGMARYAAHSPAPYQPPNPA